MFRPEQVKSRLREQPFKPFHIITSSGEKYDVYHADFVLVGERELIIGLLRSRSKQYFENVARVALMHVTALEDLPPKARARRNGRG